MVNIVATKIRANPVIFWAGVGVFSYFWKASIVASMYQRNYQQFDDQRREELNKIK
ncbi:UNKNOWN [Stylonychia lemnae]|uniref:Uncharacterized protein n=1 Tax=Stylonychia lemnae TaxID=5949 RepID=A0A078AF19_STYLE|nr:UNKNOWN [Stylonychia lemnae]|eukprot:CDW79503.1 UNKNOWN [Stylonychia lemnae]